MTLTDRELRDLIWRCAWKAYGKAPTEGDYAYWIPIWPGMEERGAQLHMPDYGEKRLLGWEAGGADIPPYGDYAQPPTPWHEVPPSPWVDQPAPGPGPVPVPPTPPVTGGVTADQVQAMLDAAAAKILAGQEAQTNRILDKAQALLPQIEAVLGGVGGVTGLVNLFKGKEGATKAKKKSKA